MPLPSDEEIVQLAKELLRQLDAMFGLRPGFRQRQTLWAYLRRAHGEIREAAPELMRLAWPSRAALAIAPLQDVLNLGPGARMNTPGQAGGNWRWD